MTSTHTYAIGDRVIIDPAVARPRHLGIVYRVTRLLPVNVIIEPAAGGRPVRVNPGDLRPAPDTDSTTTTVTPAAVTMPYTPPLHQGTLVTVSGGGWKQPPGELYVVLRDAGMGRVSFVKLGGDDGRHWSGVPRRLLSIVDPTRVHLEPDPTI
ncbi:hypothetical protein GCM10023322_79080 [Rugosimonospora acidiphila]|uniref:Uncharacterized protein n=1 Tax=Rugosimonospora acidiphila TaxID=556531 RepID=A0ABP9SSV7_9ACTN